MGELEKRDLAKYVTMLRHFPSGNGGKRRDAFLRVRYLDNRKVFFSMFLDKQKKYSFEDKIRRFPLIPHLPEVFRTVIPESLKGGKYKFVKKYKGINYVIILRDIKVRSQQRLQLLSIYPE